MIPVAFCLLASGLLTSLVAGQSDTQCGKVYIVVVDPLTAQKLPSVSKSLPKRFDVYSIGIGTPEMPLLKKIARPGDTAIKLKKPYELLGLIDSTIGKPCKG